MLTARKRWRRKPEHDDVDAAAEEPDLDQLIDLAALQEFVLWLRDWVNTQVLVISTLIQIGVIIAALAVARIAANSFGRFVATEIQRRGLVGSLRKLAEVATLFPLPIVWLLLLWVSVLVAAQTGWPHHIIRIGASLLSLWIVIRLISSLVRNPAMSRLLALTAWIIVALNVLNLLEPTIRLLDRAAINVGELRLSALLVVKGILSLALLLWVAIVVSETMERRIRRSPNLAPSVRVLLGKLLKITLIVVAILAALSYVGIDLTAFAVFSGAVGVGIGFGLQKVVSNLISGFILLLDKSIKPGDIIEVGEDFGWISSLGARYVSVETRAGKEVLIPNEDLITQRVINWSHSDNLVRVSTAIGVSYSADPRQAIALCIDAAQGVPRVLSDPKPICHLEAFGDSSVNLSLRFWISDPGNGIANVRSEVLLGIWDRFRDNGIEIPFPQRDLHIRSAVQPAAGPIPAPISAPNSAPNSAPISGAADR